jgi:CTP synthase
VRELRGIGIQPDVIVVRSDHPVDTDVQAKIALFCDVEPEAVIPMVTVDNIYKAPLILEEAGLGRLLVHGLELPVRQDPAAGLQGWRDFVAKFAQPKPRLRVGLVGKYVELEDA